MKIIRYGCHPRRLDESKIFLQDFCDKSASGDPVVIGNQNPARKTRKAA
ncbi:MAG: hypothetical protein K0R98_670 [Rickettsiaceae bacterium]|jgi:hypothetical protein|nr:hypothetical protein [Rickettsiaceae bacterium]